MLGTEKFHVGQRVRPSEYGIDRTIFAGTFRGQARSEWSGKVVKVDEFNSPTVKWDALKITHSYAPWFITADRRRPKQRKK